MKRVRESARHMKLEKFLSLLGMNEKSKGRKKTMKKLVALLLCLLMVLPLTACTSASPAAAEAASDPFGHDPNEDGKLVAAFLCAEIIGQQVQYEIDEFTRQCEAEGFDEVIVLSAENNVETQISQMRDMITKDVDVIALYSADPDGVVPGVEACNAAGIPVIAVDRSIYGGEIYFSVVSNDISDGRDIAMYFGMETAGAPEGSVKILHCIGNLSSSAQNKRHVGFRAGVESWPQLKIVAEPATEADADKTYNAVVDAFKTDPDIKCIMVTMDHLLTSVVAALEDIGKLYPPDDPNHVMLGSCDGATDQLKWLKEGINNDVIIGLDFAGFGYHAAIAAGKYIRGEEDYENKYETISYVITRDNVEMLQEQSKLWGLRPGE